MSSLDIKHTKVLTNNLKPMMDPDIRFIINQGGSRSSKTHSLMQLMIIYSLQNKNKVVSIVRKSLPALRKSVMREFFALMTEMNLYEPDRHRKMDNSYLFENGTIVEFFSIDDAQKLRGTARDILWANEANELTFEEFNQLNFRTTDKLLFDFNPSDSTHWLYDIIDRPNAAFVHSTYKDNPFLPKQLIQQIEESILVDQNYYNIYALGLPSKSTHTIYTHQRPYLEELIGYNETILGLDFGHVHPTALIRCSFREDIVYCKEMLYESGLTTPELIEEMKKALKREGLPMSTTIVADYARPEIIEELNRNGFNVHNAIKNVKEGIDAVKSYRLFYHQDSLNLNREFKNYKWKEVNERLIDEPIKLFDDALDALRYSVLYHRRNFLSVGGWEFDQF